MRSIAAATLLCLAAVACGNDKSSPSTSSTSAPPVTLSGTVNDHGTKDLAGQAETVVEVDNFYFSPTFIKTASGSKVKLELSNEGAVQHTFTIPSLGIDETLDPGANKDITVPMPASGALAFFCRFHQGSGMQGALFANAGDTVTTGTASPAASSPDNDGGYGE